mmetsp:Transcript_16495/g.22302  ORF Transcript_16495/g.22302 Transcript_16495/m.22302 type:complete len:89 (+) Transcript_16495:1240-1506(+)
MPMTAHEIDLKLRSPTPNSRKVRILDDEVGGPQSESRMRKNLGGLTQRINMFPAGGACDQDIIVVTSGLVSSKKKWKLPLHVNVRIQG